MKKARNQRQLVTSLKEVNGRITQAGKSVKRDELEQQANHFLRILYVQNCRVR